jgi:hypothetical protein
MVPKNKALRRAIINSIVLVVFCIFSSQLYAMLWVFILPVGFFVLSFFVAAAVKNMLFWIRNKAATENPWLPLLVQVFVVLVAILIPSHERSKQYYVGTYRLADNTKTNCPCDLYTEYYSVFDQGAWGTGINSVYLTDSLTFRIYLGVYDEGSEHIKVTCRQETIDVLITSEEFIDTSWSKPAIIEHKIYNLTDLEGSKKFE